MSEKLCYIHFWNCSISFRIRRKKIRFRRRSLWYAFHINWLFSLQRDVFRLQNYTYSNFFHWSSIARYPFCDFLIECSTFQLEALEALWCVKWQLKYARLLKGSFMCSYFDCIPATWSESRSLRSYLFCHYKYIQNTVLLQNQCEIQYYFEIQLKYFNKYIKQDY